MPDVVLSALQISIKRSLLTIHDAVMNTVGLSSVSIKSNNSEDLRALGRNGKSHSDFTAEIRAVKLQLHINNLNSCKSFCSEVLGAEWVLVLVPYEEHKKGQCLLLWE